MQKMMKQEKPRYSTSVARTRSVLSLEVWDCLMTIICGSSTLKRKLDTQKVTQI